LRHLPSLSAGAPRAPKPPAALQRRTKCAPLT
jgi:hypothetical protein